jgi:hypothetical protein
MIMGNAVVKFDPSKFAATVANMAKGATARVGFLKMDKTGAWSHGVDEEPIDPEALVYIDPMGFVQGWQCWANTDIPGVQAALLGDIKVPMHEPLPERPAKVPENGREWAEMRGMSCVIDGQRLVYTVTSVGGLNAIAELAEHYAHQYQADPDRMVLVVRLSSDSYKHKNKTYGRVYVPVFEPVEWVCEVPDVAAVAPEPEPVKPAKPAPAAKSAGAKKAAAARKTPPPAPQPAARKAAGNGRARV